MPHPDVPLMAWQAASARCAPASGRCASTPVCRTVPSLFGLRRRPEHCGRPRAWARLAASRQPPAAARVRPGRGCRDIEDDICPGRRRKFEGGSGGHAHGLLERGRSRRRGRHLGRSAQRCLPCRASRPVGDRAAPRAMGLDQSPRHFPMSVGVVTALLGRRSSLFESLGLRNLILNARLGFSNLDTRPSRSMWSPPTSSERRWWCSRAGQL